MRLQTGSTVRGEADPRGHSRDLRKHHDRVVGPPLGGAEAGVAKLLGTHCEPDRRLGVGLERRHASADSRRSVRPPAGRLRRVGQGHRAGLRGRAEDGFEPKGEFASSADGGEPAQVASPEPMRVIVVGAGIAGLTAADAARCAGAEVLVVEARDRIGGRIRTVPLGPGTVDLGGAWVHSPIGNPVAEALAVAGIATRNDGAYGDPMAVWADGWVEAPETTTVTAALQADWDPAEALAAIPESDRFVDGVEWFLADRGLDGRLAELARFALVWMVGALVIAGPPDRISLAGAAAYAEGSGGNLVPSGGYGALVDLLAAGLEVRLGATVTRIEHGGAQVSVVTDSGTFEGDHAIVTVPLGVLRAGAVTFDPPLPGSHASAVEHLAMGTGEKVVFRASERFGPTELADHPCSGGPGLPAWG